MSSDVPSGVSELHRSARQAQKQMAAEYPPEVARFHEALQSLAGVSDACSAIQCVDGVSSEQLALACFSELPHGAMLRTGGALPNEIQVQVEFRIEPSSSGWRSLEFISWWIRDIARSGLAIQLRPFALPPTVDVRVQLGHSLRFHIDYFFTHESRAIDPVIAAMAELAGNLRQTIDLYELSLRERGGPSLRQK